ncbi:MAG: DUF1360 domain-containing protein [Gammaproteobacteria bacterium]|nr:DUF1360 domain-containing protein [Gammaproteobacteria bacterium]
MTPFEFLILSLATWRTASLLVHEDGPWMVFRRLRERAGIVHDEQGEAAMIPDGFLAGVLSCVWCSSMWTAAGWMALFWVSPTWTMAVAGVFALSAGAVVVERVARG